MSQLSIFIDHYCVRCSAPFAAHDVLCTAIPAHGQSPIGIRIHSRCFVPTQDQWFGEVHTVPETYHAPDRDWPILVGNAHWPAYGRLMRLDNGVFRVGLLNGFPEMWSEQMIKSIPIERVWKFDLKYTLNGTDADDPELVHAVDLTQFQDMMKPLPTAPSGYLALLV